MPDVAVFGDVCGGCIVPVGTDQPVHWIAFAEVGIRASAKLAVASCTRVLQRSEMKAFHDSPTWISLPYTLRSSSARCSQPRTNPHRDRYCDLETNLRWSSSWADDSGIRGILSPWSQPVIDTSCTYLQVVGSSPQTCKLLTVWVELGLKRLASAVDGQTGT